MLLRLLVPLLCGVKEVLKVVVLVIAMPMGNSHASASSLSSLCIRSYIAANQKSDIV